MQNPATGAEFDALIIGGGPAGLSAALVLGRSRRRVLLAQEGPTRNATALAAHNVFTRDGTPPGELLRIGKEQLAPYHVVIREERVTAVERTDAGFVARFGGGGRIQARKLLLATGVRDVLPDVPGFQELWGRGVYHCPYCHGWEVAGQPLAIYARGDGALHLTRMLLGWSQDLVLFSDGASGLSDDQRAQIDRRRIPVREEPIERLRGNNGHLEAVVLAGGERVARTGLFVSPKQELNTNLHTRLGCAITDAGRIETDALGRTTVPGVYVAGDAAPGGQQVIVAAASGTMTGAALNNDLLAEEFEA